MAQRAPDWHLYRAFLAVMRGGSLSAAARALGLTQPTVGRQIATLEESLKKSLFTRSVDGLAPTEAASQLLAPAEAMSAAAEAALRAVSGQSEEESGTVRITASDVIGAEVLPVPLARLQNDYRQITIELALTNRNEDLLRGEADVAVRMVRPTQDALIARRIGKIDIGLYAHRRYLKVRGVPRGISDLAQHALIGYDRDPKYAQRLAQLGVELGHKTFSFKSDSELAQLAALRAGAGIGVSQIGIARRDKDLVPVLHPDVGFPLEMWLVMHKDLKNNQRIRLVFNHLAHELQVYAGSGTR